MRPVIFDTDIGTDVDDILALAVLAKSPELELIGVTTVYGDTRLRARIAKVTCDLLGCADTAVLIGEKETLARRQIAWAGHEGYGVPHLDKAEVPAIPGAVDYLLDAANRFAGDLEVLATGPLTNIATAIIKDAPGFSKIKHLYLMGGAYWLDRPEHNIKSDPEAAKIVFESGIPITAIGLDITLRVLLDANDVRQIAQLRNGVGALLEDQILRWWELRNITANHPHDPLAALAMVRPDLFIFENWDVDVTKDGRTEGLTRLREPKKGKTRIGADVFARTAQKEIVKRIVGA
ncbi:MAG: nucleoside hydrolase [Verrucomicrobia bacterium]|nr:nucleoside hydrolase [Verrucomicrobiota bacterium]MBV8278115.1 nucleoside hydrolase [Verrucomicrobiota bacterium]